MTLEAQSDARLINFGLALNGPGFNMNAWRHPASRPDASTSFDFTLDTVRAAEDNGFAFAFVADGLFINEKSVPHVLNRFEPITLLSALASATSRIGLAGTVSTSYSLPYTVARQFASLDLISGGRAAWNVVTSLEGAAANYGSAAHPDHSLRYRIADEYLSVAQGLWDSWDDGAFVRDRAAGIYVDRAGMHPLDHEGEFFQVAGPLNIQRSPQGQPVLFQAGSSDSGIALAGKYADVVITNPGSLEETIAFRQRVKDSAAAHGRPADAVRVFPGISVIADGSSEVAEAEYRTIRDLLSVEEALIYLGRFFNHDFSSYPLDAPFPDLGHVGENSFRSATDRIKDNARAKGSTLREVALDVATARPQFIGTGETIADELVGWVDAGAADGFLLTFPVQAGVFEAFIARVLPALEARGRYRRSLPGTTLRDHLGLPRKQSRYSSQAR